jgi:hypothetical protein
MRLLPLALLLVASCAPAAAPSSASAAPAAAPEASREASPAPPASGALIKASYAELAPGSEVTLDVTPGADARLLLALGDRVSELDLTPAVPHEKQAEALVAFAPVKARERARIRVRARPWAGHEVMSAFVQPFGGDAGAKALAEASPDFVKRKMIEVQLDVTVGERTQSQTRRLVVALGDEPARSTSHDVAGVMAFGVPVRIQDWVMATGGSAYVPAVSMAPGGTTLSASAVDGTQVPLETLAAAAWTLWMQIEPAGAP